ncbi:translation initiation factor 2 [Pseudomonas sp. LS1212]|uniref:translation initiation factor 2 n=1 Tax=Pseudomonas sp. LS1212 TaxID=2972478 RepID=UPI00215D0BE9|nr:translation initiation factor 2 [Pseudomonas sp. LS1212]UVJ42485.1 translation initiation factor 2 [Pseudomonas sp. LS1212]
MKFFYPAGLLFLCLFNPLVLTSAHAAVEAGVSSRLLLADSKTQAESSVKPSAKTSGKAVASKSTARQSAEVIATRLPKAHLDLSLPPEMVEELEPPSQVIGRQRQETPPVLFGDKPAESPYQLNGRLLNNELDLQLRDRRDVEGAAIEFEYRH